MSVTLTPLGDRLLVQLRPQAVQVGHILLPSRHESAREANVIAVGPAVRDVAVGDVVLVSVLGAVAQVGDAAIYQESSVLGVL